MAADLQITAGLDASNVSAGLNKIGQGMKSAQASAANFSKSLIESGKAWAVSFAGNLASTAVSSAIGKIKDTMVGAAKDAMTVEDAAASTAVNLRIAGSQVESIYGDILTLSEKTKIGVTDVGAAFLAVSRSASKIDRAGLNAIVTEGAALFRVMRDRGSLADATKAISEASKVFGIKDLSEAKRFVFDFARLGDMDFSGVTAMIGKINNRISKEGALSFFAAARESGVSIEDARTALEGLSKGMDKIGLAKGASLLDMLKELSRLKKERTVGGNEKLANFDEKTLSVVDRLGVGTAEFVENFNQAVSAESNFNAALTTMATTSASIKDIWAEVNGEFIKLAKDLMPDIRDALTEIATAFRDNREEIKQFMKDFGALAKLGVDLATLLLPRQSRADEFAEKAVSTPQVVKNAAGYNTVQAPMTREEVEDLPEQRMRRAKEMGTLQSPGDVFRGLMMIVDQVRGLRADLK